ncbi:MAG: DMT family transporter [Patescibacteria group bacterium]|nr:DMT family transporter [Patescibacteria group bacterium]
MWFIYALLGAVGKSYAGFFRKKIANSIGGSTYIWIGYSLILLIMTPFMFVQLPEVLDSFTKFPAVVFGAALSYLVATQLNLEALKREDLSYTAPLNAFVPVFTLAIAVPFLSETPPKFGLIGIALVVSGAYIVSIKPDRVSWTDPLKRLLTSTGARLSLGVALCYAINTILMKILTNHHFSAFVVLYVTTLVGWLLLVNVPISRRNELKAIRPSDKIAVLGGSLSSFAGSFFHILALANTFTSYATAVRRLDAVISVMLGWRYLDEKNIRIKLAGSIIMTVGAVIIAVS